MGQGRSDWRRPLTCPYLLPSTGNVIPIVSHDAAVATFRPSRAELGHGRGFVWPQKAAKGVEHVVAKGNDSASMLMCWRRCTGVPKKTINTLIYNV